MDLNEYRAIKDYDYIEIIIGDTYLKLDSSNSINFIYKDGDIFIKISSEVFSDDMIQLYKDIIKMTLDDKEYYISIKFNIIEINTKGKEVVKKNIIHCSFGIPNDINILEINYGEITSIDYYFKVNDINDLNL